MTLKTARRGALLTVAGAAAFALTACGAGQISQTADQVAAVDGSGANTSNGETAVRDVTVIVDHDGSAALKFTAVNQDAADKAHKLSSVKVDGKEVQISEKPELKRNCSLVVDSKKNIEALPKSDATCINYATSEIENNGLAIGGVKPVEFTFDSGTIKLDAAITTNHNEDDNNDARVDREHGNEADHGDHSGHKH